MLHFSPEEKAELLDLARKTIMSKLEGYANYESTKNPRFLENRGVFVTLEKNGELRGCIGNIESLNSIWQGIIDNAQAAAFEDPRFLPIQQEELNDLKIEISVLTKPEATNPEHIKPGVDGVVIRLGENKSTYLPQVWDHFKIKEDFLESLCVKAGLPENAWKDPKAQLFTYQVEKFRE